MALVHVRHAGLLALVAPLLIAAPVGRQLARVATPIRPLGPVVTGACGAIAVCAVLALTMRPAAPPAHNAPAAALASIRQATLGPILNDYQFGGYLIFVGEAPSIDGRADLYGEPFILRHYHALNGRDGTALRSFVDEHRIAATLLLSTTPAVALLDSMPDWRRVYSDSLAVAHVRR
jgi:hypothetical protein